LAAASALGVRRYDAAFVVKKQFTAEDAEDAEAFVARASRP